MKLMWSDVAVRPTHRTESTNRTSQLAVSQVADWSTRGWNFSCFFGIWSFYNSCLNYFKSNLTTLQYRLSLTILFDDASGVGSLY